ncbi:MAG TPA: hypothetical protein ENN41_08705 [Sediminispirochaeta sp.]|nr:hypothetical protein [Sediminispirochaeta sp.]
MIRILLITAIGGLLNFTPMISLKTPGMREFSSHGTTVYAMEKDAAEVERAAVHEYVHVLTDRRNKGMDYWLKEGFSLYLAGQQPSAEAIRRARDITFHEFQNPNAIQFAEVGGYTLAYALMEYLEQEYGWERVLEFLQPDHGYPEVTGYDKELVFKDWLMDI